MSHLERTRVRFSCEAESRRPNPHKSVALAGQERPFLAVFVRVGIERARLNRAGGRPGPGRPFVRPRRMESHLA